jgi:hypothetical protein
MSKGPPAARNGLGRCGSGSPPPPRAGRRDQFLEGRAGVVSGRASETQDPCGVAHQFRQDGGQGAGDLVQGGPQGFGLGEPGRAQDAARQGQGQRVLGREGRDREHPALVREDVGSALRVILDGDPAS